MLAAAARRIAGRTSRSNEEIASASIPIPDATGVVENWEEHYPTGRWVDPAGYVKSSDTVEQSIDGFLLNGISYDMDERDVAWLDKHNASARGEGTSASASAAAAAASAAAAAASPARNAKNSRGKEAAAAAASAAAAVSDASFVITENEFELTMGLLEKFTDDKCPYLHLVRSLWFKVSIFVY